MMKHQPKQTAAVQGPVRLLLSPLALLEELHMGYQQSKRFASLSADEQITLGASVQGLKESLQQKQVR